MRLEFPSFAKDRAERHSKIPRWMAAASSGDIDAQLALAWEYARGEVVDCDLVSAGNLFDRAAESGQEEACVNRARFLQLRRVPRGIRDLRKFAAQGNWKAQFWLARYYQGCAGRFRQLKAVVWYDRCAKSGGGSAATLAKLGQLTRIAPWRSKLIFLSRGIVKLIAVLWRIMRHSEQIDVYEPLMYRLKRRNN